MENLCKNCIYDGSIFELCDNHRRNFSRPFNNQYDEFYKDCTTMTQLVPCMVALGSCGMTPPRLDEYTDFDKTKFLIRSDIPAPDFFNDQINKHIRKWVLQPQEIKDILGALRSPEYALASWEFNETFESLPFKATFKEEYDMAVVNEIIELAKKIKKITRIS